MDRTGEGDPTEWMSGMVDLSDMSLGALRALGEQGELGKLGELTTGDDSPLAATLRRVAAELAEPDDPIAGFNSAL